VPRSAAVGLVLAGLLGCSPAGVAPGGEERLRGRAVRTGEAVTLVPCGEAAGVRLVRLPPELVEAFQVLPEASSSLSIEVRGVREGETFRVTALRRAAAHADLCREDPAGWLFRATGNEPFWTATLAPRGIVWTEARQLAPALYPLPSPVVEGTRRTYTSASRTVPGDTIEVVLEEGPCLDSMSGDLFPFRAEVHRQGRAARGCAAEGTAR